MGELPLDLTICSLQPAPRRFYHGPRAILACNDRQIGLIGIPASDRSRRIVTGFVAKPRLSRIGRSESGRADNSYHGCRPSIRATLTVNSFCSFDKFLRLIERIDLAERTSVARTLRGNSQTCAGILLISFIRTCRDFKTDSHRSSNRRHR